jgi:hypothetical protein
LLWNFLNSTIHKAWNGQVPLASWLRARNVAWSLSSVNSMKVSIFHACTRVDPWRKAGRVSSLPHVADGYR